MSNRTSNKQILEAIEGLTAAILAGQGTTAPQPSAEVEVASEEPKAKPSKVKVSKAYFNAMLPKWQALANTKGETYVGYAYRKSNGKVGLWAVPKTKIASKEATDSFLGAVTEVNPS